MDFEAARYIKEQNEKEAGARAGNHVETPGRPVDAAVKDASAESENDGDNEEEPQRGSAGDGARRSARRTENRLREEAAEERGRRLALEEMVAKGLMPHAAKPEDKKTESDSDPEPLRKDFPDGPAGEAAYNRASGRWDARQETKAELGKRDKQADQEAQLAQLREVIAESHEKMIEDIKLIPDWEEHKKKAEADPESPKFYVDKHPYLVRRLQTSDVQAFVLDHLCVNYGDMQKALDLSASGDLIALDRFISRLEGRVEKLYSTERDDNVPDEKRNSKPESAAERDAKKPKPSENGAPRGGSAPRNTVKPYLEDGKTINPAWKTQRNETETLRR